MYIFDDYATFIRTKTKDSNRFKIKANINADGYIYCIVFIQKK